MDSLLDRRPETLPRPSRIARGTTAPWGKAAHRPVRIALVNNMPDSALAATERQFTRLVSTAAGAAAEISLFHIPALPRGEEARRMLAERYRPVDQLHAMGADAVIVTGNEPRAARLDDEPYWSDLTRLIDFVRASGCFSLWSCLAAHAAVLHLDGIERRLMPQKKSGVLACTTKAAGGLLPAQMSVCHSRMNTLDKQELVSKGYSILSEAPGGHVDIFAKRSGGRFLFLQGHPEYDADTLMREYRRDVGRFLGGQRASYPEVPENYFDAETTIAMENFRTEAEGSRDIKLFERFPDVTLRAGLEERLAQSAAAVFAFWLSEVNAAMAA